MEYHLKVDTYQFFVVVINKCRTSGFAMQTCNLTNISAQKHGNSELSFRKDTTIKHSCKI